MYNSDCTGFVASEYSSKVQAYVVCDVNGFATKVEWTKLIYSETDCKGDVSGELRSIYDTEKVADAKDRSDIVFSL